MKKYYGIWMLCIFALVLATFFHPFQFYVDQMGMELGEEAQRCVLCLDKKYQVFLGTASVLVGIGTLLEGKRRWRERS